MLDGLLNRGFSSKCKSLLKATRTRIEVVRRRAEAKQRFLKEDLAKLLANGLDINAYGRTEEFLAGLNLLSCYDYIEQSCDYVVKNLSSMQKQSECPEECREAVASLMFAAARFSDLPELRDVRDLFQERYGNSIECFVNQKFVEKLSSRPPIMEKRLQLLQDIASEFSMNWDSKGFQQRMAPPSMPAQAQADKYRHSIVAADKCNLLVAKRNVAQSDKDDVLPKETPVVSNVGHRMHCGKEGTKSRKEVDLHFCGRQERSANDKQVCYKGEPTALNHNNVVFYERGEGKLGKHERMVKKDAGALKAEKASSSSNRNQLESFSIAYTRQDYVKDDMHKRESWKPLSQNKTATCPSFGEIPRKNDIFSVCQQGSSQNEVNSLKHVKEEDIDGLKSHRNTRCPPSYVTPKCNALPPPYVIPKDGNQKISRPEHAGSYCDGHSINTPVHSRVKVNCSDSKIKELDNHVHEEQINGSTRESSHEKGYDYQDDKVSLPKRRSTRRKHHKSLSSHNGAEVVKRSSSSRRQEHSRKGLQILMDIEHYRKDDEERMIDKLLLHYSKKPSTYDDFGKSRKTYEPHASHQGAIDTGESSYDRDKDGYVAKPEIILPPPRSVSLPHEQSTTSEAKKIFSRANSFQPDSQARHVHPKLPDYDDLAARFAALKGR